MEKIAANCGSPLPEQRSRIGLFIPGNASHADLLSNCWAPRMAALAASPHHRRTAAVRVHAGNLGRAMSEAVE